MKKGDGVKGEKKGGMGGRGTEAIIESGGADGVVIKLKLITL